MPLYLLFNLFYRNKLWMDFLCLCTQKFTNANILKAVPLIVEYCFISIKQFPNPKQVRYFEINSLSFQSLQMSLAAQSYFQITVSDSCNLNHPALFCSGTPVLSAGDHPSKLQSRVKLNNTNICHHSVEISTFAKIAFWSIEAEVI